MIKLFIYCFDKWWRPILFFVLAIVLIVTSTSIKSETYDTISTTLFGFGLLGLIISTIYQLTKKRWLYGVLTGLLFCLTIGAFLLYAIFMFVSETLEGDKWADNLKIPSNIQLDIPIDLIKDNQRQDSVLDWAKSKPDFQLYNSSQPGLYEFDFWMGKIESGTIYLKAFEITSKHELSTHSLPRRSAVRIYNPTDTILKFGTTANFTIYEGDWGKPYAARFEVWFKPDEGGQERKLFTKNYKIEGWQR